MDTSKRAIIYIASGQEYIDEAVRSRSSLIENCKDPYSAFIFGPDNERLPSRQHDSWYLDSVNYFNHILNALDDYDQFLYLDTDTYICGDLEDFFTALDRFDIVGTHAVGRETMVQRDDIPASFPELHIGALAFKRNAAIRHLFSKWLVTYQMNPDYFGNNDQGPLRQALWEMRTIKLGILPQEFCFRYRWGGLITGQVRVLHGRENNTPYEQIAKEVNSSNKPRVFHRRELA